MNAGSIVQEHTARSEHGAEVFAGFAPVDFAGHRGTFNEADELAELSPWRGDPLTDLPQTAAEVGEVADIVSGEQFLMGLSSEVSFRRHAPQHAILHIATHGRVDSIRPECSGLLLYHDALPTPSPVQQMATESDDVLFASEISQLELEADLVVLSACETGSGRLRRGEGVMSLARAFNYAGVPNVVASLWKVDDLATKEIMVKFYEKLAEGLGKADALAEAKRWYRRTYPNEPPSKWAAFILIGDNEPVRLKKRSPIRPWMRGAGVLVVLAGGAFLWQRSRRAAA